MPTGLTSLKQELIGVPIHDALPDMEKWGYRALEHLMDVQTGLEALGTEVESEEGQKEFFS